MIVTIPIYFLLLVTLHKNRHDELLKSPFFRFMFSVGLANMGQIFTILLGNTLASSGLVPGFYIWMGGLSSRLYNCGVIGFGSAQLIGITWIVTALLTIPVAFVFEFKICIENDNRTVYFQWTSAAESGLYTMLTGGLLGGLMTIIIIVAYAIIFAVALIRKVKSGRAISKTEKTALHMAVIGFICSFGLLIYLGDLMTQMIAWHLFRYNFLDVETNYMIINVGNSLFAAIDPYAMFLFSATVPEVPLTEVVNREQVGALRADAVLDKCVLLSAQMLWYDEMIEGGHRALCDANEQLEAKTTKIQRLCAEVGELRVELERHGREKRNKSHYCASKPKEAFAPALIQQRKDEFFGPIIQYLEAGISYWTTPPSLNAS
uniref:Uncharacterized protein n=2 Tax=Plectus sambesii TaxID=2011161 RepID=A0A914W8A3_9BILA